MNTVGLYSWMHWAYIHEYDWTVFMDALNVILINTTQLVFTNTGMNTVHLAFPDVPRVY